MDRMKRDHALPLTDLGSVRPQSRGGATSPSNKRKSQTRQARGTTRINQIFVNATAGASYTVRDEDQDEAVGKESNPPPLAKDSRFNASTLKRSKTAPGGLKRLQNNEAVETTTSSKANVASDIAFIRPVSVQRPRAQFPPLPLTRTVDDDDEGPDAAAGSRAALSAKPDDSKRPFGEMIECEDVSKLCSRLGITRKDVWCLRKAFNEEDTDNTNTITFTSFFYIVHEEKRALTKSILRLAGLSSPSQTRLTFDEFLRCVITFASFSEPELLQFFFQVYSDNTSATKPRGPSQTSMVESDLMKLGEDLQVLKSAFAGNVRQVTSELAVGGTLGTSFEGNWTFQEFERFSRLHQVAFYPLFQIQRNVRRAGDLGEAYWIQKTSDKALVQRLLLYMRQNHGFQPPLPLKDRIWRYVLQRPTTQTRVRELAKKLYTG